jgi:S-adenosylmethionine:tRNA ribosyltransferase-isomerase
MLVSDFNYDLPRELIAKRPAASRDASRMLVVDRVSGSLADRLFAELPDLLRGDELVIVNDARVIPARLFAHRLGVHAARPEKTGSHDFLSASIEVLLAKRLEPNLWEALVRPGRKVSKGERLVFENSSLAAEVVGRGAYGLRTLRFSGLPDLLEEIERIGHVPLPPYLDRPDELADRERYQTVFAANPGAVAAPTAALHFTPAILGRIRARGVELRSVTLDVGLGTFQPIHTETVEEHKMHTETYEVPEETAAAITAARRAGRPILAVGTTVVRTLEDAAAKGGGEVRPGRGEAGLFIRPGYRFAVVNQLLTNFHLPGSTLLILVAAFAGWEAVLIAYRQAIAERYRFYSYGDCSLIR